MRESARVARKGVMSLVPNAGSLPYRVGKDLMEREGRWRYGIETPKFTMADDFRRAGLRNIAEHTVGSWHALEFWGKDLPDLGRFLAGLSQEELAEQAQVSARTISDVERGVRSRIYRDTADRLSRALGLDESEHAALVAAGRSRPPWCGPGWSSESGEA